MKVQREETEVVAVIYGQKLITSKIMNQTYGSMTAQLVWLVTFSRQSYSFGHL
jgi:hypothetical protein